jgi:hypothetical protein
MVRIRSSPRRKQRKKTRRELQLTGAEEEDDDDREVRSSEDEWQMPPRTQIDFNSVCCIWFVARFVEYTYLLCRIFWTD